VQITKFINRKEELNSLDKLWRGDKAEFVVIYGRRRIGKTELIKQFIKNKPSIYYFARLESEKDQLDSISATFSDFFSDAVIKKSSLTTWDAVFEYLYQKNERFVFVIDEFPNLIHSEKNLSVIQEYWDEKLKHTKIFMIFCGSSLSMMEKYVFDYKTPIYGRRTYDLLVGSLKFKDVCEFFPNTDVEEIVKIYGVLGGTPAYLLEFSSDLDRTILNIIQKRSFLHREPEFVLREEVSEPRYFMSILHAISVGKTTINEIVNLTGLERGLVGKYISILRDLDLAERDVSVTESWKTRKSIYRIKDNFFNFWFRFIYSNMQEIEQNPEFAVDDVKRNFNSYVGFVFEKIAKEFLMEKKPFKFQKIGRWWDKDKEIDIVALNEEIKEILFVECKWKDMDEETSVKILEKLKEKAKFVEWNNDNRKEYFGIIGKRIENKEKLRKEGFIAFDLNDFKFSG